MLTNSIYEFKKGITELKRYISFINQSDSVVQEAVKNDCFGNEEIKTLISILNDFKMKSSFEYNSFIISLYGLFERFLENLIAEYLTNACRLSSSFANLNEAIKTNHLLLTTDLLKNLEYPKYKDLDAKRIVEILHQSLNENIPNINKEAFQHHPYNFKQTIISDYFKQIGVEGISKTACNYEPLKSVLISKYNNHSNKSLDIIFSIINDLAQRRNDVAHGVDKIIILDRKDILDYIDFIEVYCQSLVHVLDDNLIKFQCQETFAKFEVVKVYNSEIVAVKASNQILKVGDTVIIKRSDVNYPQYIISTIQSLQIENIDYPYLMLFDELKIAMKLSARCKVNNEFYFKAN